jgi:hypothetical protein
VIALATALLATCASQPRSPLDDPAAMSALMARLGGALFSGTDRCLTRREYSVQVIDDRHLLFRQRDTVWVNELRARCPGLLQAGRGMETLVFEPSGSTLCEFDRVGVLDRLSRQPRIRPACPLGVFRRVNQAIVGNLLGQPVEPPERR